MAEAEALSGRILDASWEVLLVDGLDAFTFDRLARHAHIGKATIYSRFPGKRELFRALLARWITQRIAALEAQGSHLSSEAAFRLRAVDTMTMLFSPDGQLSERLIDWLEQESGGAERLRAKVYAYALESIARALQLTRDGEATALELTSAQVARASRIWLEGLLGHARLAFSEGDSTQPAIAQWASDYARFFFAGLTAMAHGEADDARVPQDGRNQ